MTEGVIVGAAFAQDGEVIGDAGQVGAGPLIPGGFVRVVLVGALDGFRRPIERAVAEGLLHEAKPRQRDARGVDLAELETVERLVGGGVDTVVRLGSVGRGDIVDQQRGSRLRDRKTGASSSARKRRSTSSKTRTLSGRRPRARNAAPCSSFQTKASPGSSSAAAAAKVATIS